MKVFIVYRHDRRADPGITVHTTRAGADQAIEEFMDRYGDRYEWAEEDYGRDSGWVRYVTSDSDDGPNARIEETEMQE